MSVANTLVTEHAAHLVTDGGWTDLASGTLIDIKEKTIPLPDINSAFTALGGAWIGPYVAQDIAQRGYKSYGELVAGVANNLPMTIRAVYDQVAGAPKHWGEFVLVFVGWEKAGKADILHVIDRGGDPKITRIAAPSFVSIPCGIALDSDDIENSANALLDAQRAVVTPGEPCVAAGFVHMTTVSAAGIASKRLKAWPDKIGQPANRY